MKKIFPCLFAFAMVACTSTGSQQTTENPPVDSSAIKNITSNTLDNASKKPQDNVVYYMEDVLACQNFECLLKKYGEEHIRKNAKVPAAEGQEADATLLYPDTDDELQVFWKEGKQFKEIESVILTAHFGRDDKISFYTHWQSKRGVRLGMKLSEIVVINKKNFTMSGFGWDYGGNVVSWEGGQLTDKGVHIRFALMDETNLTEAEKNSVMGETEFNVSLPVIKKLNPLVDEITISSSKAIIQ